MRSFEGDKYEPSTSANWAIADASGPQDPQVQPGEWLACPQMKDLAGSGRRLRQEARGKEAIKPVVKSRGQEEEQLAPGSNRPAPKKPQKRSSGPGRRSRQVAGSQQERQTFVEMERVRGRGLRVKGSGWVRGMEDGKRQAYPIKAEDETKVGYEEWAGWGSIRVGTRGTKRLGKGAGRQNASEAWMGRMAVMNAGTAGLRVVRARVKGAPSQQDPSV